MVSLLLGIILFAGAIAAFVWATPKDGKPSRIPNKWGMGTAFPILVMAVALLGFILVAKAVF
jgi:small-conductance mechanosensitive channel